MHPLRAYIQRFVALTDAEWEPLAVALRSAHLARHGHFVEAGQTRAELALVLGGALRLYYPRASGEERTTYFSLKTTCLLIIRAASRGSPASSAFRP